MHFEAMDQYHAVFAHLYDQLLVEELRLKALPRDVTWYHFETVVRDWKRPWPKSVGESPRPVHAIRVQSDWRDVTFYIGPDEDANNFFDNNRRRPELQALRQMTSRRCHRAKLRLQPELAWDGPFSASSARDVGPMARRA